MKPAPFQYARAEDVGHALALLKEHGEDARLLAGGQSLVPMMNLRLARPGILVDIGHLGLDAIRRAETELALDPLVRHRMLLQDKAVADAAPVVREAMSYVAHPTVRNLGTAGGSLAHADPTAELSALLVLLDGAVTARESGGERRIDAPDFFRAAFTTSLRPVEMIVGIHFSLPRGRWGGAFVEMAERTGDFAIAAAGAVLVLDGGRIAAARLVLVGAESAPVRAPEAERALAGATLSADLARAAGALAVENHESYGDARASAAYRRHLLGELARRAILKAHAQAAGEQ
ncbi:MAG: xanthine dehydrogenase family protein subunit M [Rhodospirillales bacterium]|nr:xanthine dehydrogenase family protein subunit M [Rhodospirillales bacterium]